MSRRPVVQFVSKPIVAPFRDGTKCLVRDLALQLREYEPEVLGIEPTIEELPGVRVRAVYGADGGYAPGLVQNLRAASWLLLRSRADLWHFVFAPNVRSSQVGRSLRALRGKPCVQTVASPPRSFEEPSRLLFGDIVVAQSAHTKASFEKANAGGKPFRIEELPPPWPELAPVAPGRISAVRNEIGVRQEERIFLYPGDLEVSQGAERVAELCRALRERSSDATVVFAYRNKTGRAALRAAELERSLEGTRAIFVPNVSDIHALVAASLAILFPVDDLYGKVDLPIVLLEAFRLRTPVLSTDEGPLASLVAAEQLPWDVRAWTDRLVELQNGESLRAGLAETAYTLAARHYDARRIAGAYEGFYSELLRR